MPLSVTTDHSTIAARLDELLAADPVRGTVLGTIRNTLEDSAWAAFDGACVAVRSGAQWPVLLAGRCSDDARVELVRHLAMLPGFRGLSGAADEVQPMLDAMARPDLRVRMRSRLFRLAELTPPSGVPGSAVRAGSEHRALVREWYLAFADEADAIGPRSHEGADRSLLEGGCWLWLDGCGAPVSLATRRAVVAGSARIGPVYTPPGERGRGYGSAVTAAATRDILDDGAVPVLFTDLANPTSNKIYKQLGYRPVEDRLMAMFD